MKVCPGLSPSPGGSRTLDNIRSKKMAQEYDIRKMADKIRALKQNATEIKEMSGGIPAVDRNVDCILASVRMLEISVVDVADMLRD